MNASPKKTGFTSAYQSSRGAMGMYSCPCLPSPPRNAYALALITLLACAAAPSFADTPATQPALTWHETLADGRAAAERTPRPMLVYAGAAWCGPCRLLAVEFEKPAVHAELSRWSLVHLDVDTSDDARALHIGSIPALRVYTIDGRLLASREGYLPGDELVKWLTEVRDRAGIKSQEDPAAPPPPLDLEARLADLTAADAIVRERAIHRLAPHAALAAPRVADVLAGGKLAARLSALDLLTTWNAPVAGLDPWQPETLTPQRLAAVRAWATATTRPSPATTRAAAIPATTTAATFPSIDPQALADARIEIARMLAATDPTVAVTVRERLAVLGESLLPEVRSQLHRAASPTDKQRLLALRYRLVSTEARSLAWPGGGLDRLAASDTTVRHAAVSEIEAAALPSDVPLFREMFSDPDPFVREMSLRALRKVGGPGATDSLIHLLEDPDPNVRAAVLGELADTPSDDFIPRIAQYLAQEPDLDLVVHAIRALRATKSAACIDPLSKLLTHESWRIRGEAVEALTDIALGANSHGKDNGDAVKNRAFAAIIGRLDDPDGFVVGRVLWALKKGGQTSAVPAMIKAAESHPNLTMDVVRTLGENSLMADLAADPLRKTFIKNADAAIRAAAVRALASIDDANNAQQFTAALKDPDPNVRIAAAVALQDVIQTLLPTGERRTKQGRVTHIEHVPAPSDLDAWLTDFRSGKTAPPWLTAARSDLKAMAARTASDALQERITAAVLLTALGDDETAWPILTSPPAAAHRDWVSRALPWLPWEKRQELLKRLTSGDVDGHDLRLIIQQMSAYREPRATPPLWQLLSHEHLTADVAGSVFEALRKGYLGDRYYDPNSASEDVRRRMVTESQQAIDSAAEFQIVVGLAILVMASPDQAATAAAKIYTAESTPLELRGDALRIQLITRKPADARKLAVEALSHPQAPPRKIAIEFLSGDASDINYLHGHIYLTYHRSYSGPGDSDDADDNARPYDSQGHPVLPKPPKGATPEQIRPLLEDPDEEIATRAGYLLALMGDRSGLDQIIRVWRKQKTHWLWRRVTYKAIAAAGNDNDVPVLVELYNTLDNDTYDRREFYWIIKSRMTGPNATALLRRVLKDIPPDELR